MFKTFGIMMVVVVLANIALLAGAIWAVVLVLRALGVIS